MSHVFVNVFSLLLYSFSRILDNCGSREIGLQLLKSLWQQWQQEQFQLTISSCTTPDDELQEADDNEAWIEHNSTTEHRGTLNLPEIRGQVTTYPVRQGSSRQLKIAFNKEQLCLRKLSARASACVGSTCGGRQRPTWHTTSRYCNVTSVVSQRMGFHKSTLVARGANMQLDPSCVSVPPATNVDLYACFAERLFKSSSISYLPCRRGVMRVQQLIVGWFKQAFRKMFCKTVPHFTHVKNM